MTLLGLAIISLTGCGTVFDPAPYSPTLDQSVLNSGHPPYTSATVLAFSTPADAAPKLQALSDGYASQRDALMRQELLFDLPMIGLAAAAVVNPLFNGAKNSTLGLGLGAGVAGAGRIYFGPQAKITAYNAASLELACGAQSAASIATEQPADENAAQGLIAKLNADIDAATPLLSGSTSLLAARDQAVKSLSALQTALLTLDGAPNTLAGFAFTVIRTATNAVVTNVQNVSAAEQLITAAATPKTTGAPARPALPVAAPTKTELPSALQNDAAAADAVTQRINSLMGQLPKCLATS